MPLSATETSATSLSTPISAGPITGLAGNPAKDARFGRTIRLIKPDLPSLESISAPLREILESGSITNFSKYVRRFESQASEYLDAHVATTSSGTQGLIFALQALGVQPGQKVLLPSFTFMATAQAVLYAGAVPVFAEIEDDLTVSPADLERLLSAHEDVAAVIGVHTYGLPCHVSEIREVVNTAAARRGKPISLLYDAAHAFGSALDGRRVGGFGDAEVFSLSVTKALVSVEGGMVASRDAALIERIKKMRNYGIEGNYNAGFHGLNGKMSEFHAIVGLYNIERLDYYLACRQRSARYYLDGIHSRTNFQTFPWPGGVTHTFKDFTVLTPGSLEGRRDEVIAALKEDGVETRAYFYPPVHEQSFFRRFADRSLPRTEALTRRVITLPFYTTITEADMDYVVEALSRAERRLA
jgi:dTDP-4-amino-4,6-dideoxygalactose transaminase